MPDTVRSRSLATSAGPVAGADGALAMEAFLFGLSGGDRSADAGSGFVGQGRCIVRGLLGVSHEIAELWLALVGLSKYVLGDVDRRAGERRQGQRVAWSGIDRGAASQHNLREEDAAVSFTIRTSRSSPPAAWRSDAAK